MRRFRRIRRPSFVLGEEESFFVCNDLRGGVDIYRTRRNGMMVPRSPTIDCMLVYVPKVHMNDGIIMSPHAQSSWRRRLLPCLLPFSLVRSETPAMRTVTVTTDVECGQATPTLPPGSAGYAYHGCFHQLRPSLGGLTVGQGLIIPANVSASNLTVPLCLSACAASNSSTGCAYTFAAMGGGRLVSPNPMYLSQSCGR